MASRLLMHEWSAEQHMTTSAVDAIIRDQVTRHFGGRYGDQLAALILTGSLARNEGTIVEEQGVRRVAGDAEFLLIFGRSTRKLPDASDLSADCRAIEAALRKVGVACEVGANRAYPEYLRRMKPHIFGYELRQCGQVLVGNPGILREIPPFGAAEIPLEDGWQLLMNRLIELLKSMSRAGVADGRMPSDLHYRVVKLYLDMATSLLVFVRAFEAGYRARYQRLRTVIQQVSDLPFEVEAFVDRVAEATRQKLGESRDGTLQTWDHLTEALSFAQRLWRWELARLTGAPSSASDGELMKRWARSQSWAARIRGWVCPLRNPSLRGELLRHPAWIAGAWRSSPRLCVYEAAADVVFELPRMIAGLAPSRSVGARRLPLGNRGTAEWTDYAQAIVRNYEELLIGTRA